MIANGDIVDARSARKALELSGADGVMVGRGIQGAPWRVAEIAHALGWGPAPCVPTGRHFVEMVLDHYEASLAFYGEDLGAKVIRKHLGWYMDQSGTPAELRKAVLTSKPNTVRSVLPDALQPRLAA